MKHTMIYTRAKKLLLLCFVFAMSKGYAQSGDSKTRFSVLGGVNLQNLNGKDYFGKKMENKMIVGFHAGFNALIPIATEFYIQPGLLFSTKGGKQKEDSFTNTVKLSYLEIPINFVYRASLGKGYIMLGFGPYFAFGLKGSNTFEMNSTEKKSDIKFQSEVNVNSPSDDATYVKRFDSGANIFFGFEMESGLFFQLNTQLGMLKINPKYTYLPDDKSSVKNTGFGLSAGFRF